MKGVVVDILGVEQYHYKSVLAMYEVVSEFPGVCRSDILLVLAFISRGQ